MPRSGGEAAKLGDYYEHVWTADSLLDLLSDEAVSVTLEPFDRTEAEGIEFIKELKEATLEYHSAKRQKVGLAWSMADLARTSPNGRSILGDLLAKLARHSNARALFISQTGANELLELHDRARRCATPTDWDSQLKDCSKHIIEDFGRYLLPLCDGRSDVALDRLQRLRALPFEEQELVKRVAQRTEQWIYRPDGGEVNTEEVRHVLGEFVIQRLGQTVRKADLLAELERCGYHLRVWAKEPSVLARVADVNEIYLRPIRQQFINGNLIARTAAKRAIEGLRSTGKKAQLVIGSAGLGKSCVMAETVVQLISEGVPVLALRLDNLPHVLTTKNLGAALSLSTSPAIVLAGVANGGCCVLVLDQLDALSLVSGRNDHLWPVFDQLVAEAGRVPNMRLLLACGQRQLFLSSDDN